MKVAGPNSTVEDSRASAGAPLAFHPFLVRLIDCGQPLARSARHLLGEVDSVLIGRGPLGGERRRENERKILWLTEPDARVSGSHARLDREMRSWILEDLGSKNGTLVNGERVKSVALQDGDLIEVGRTFFLFRELALMEPGAPADVVVDGAAPVGWQTLHPTLSRDLAELAKMARSSVSIVIHGETGTGKELIARGIHELSARAGAFVAVNCGAIPDSLVESELFGVKRGAFSDAKEDRPGTIRSAHRGTLFLDELAELKLELQPAFLRVLQEREVVPIGQAQGVLVDVRLVSASQTELSSLSSAGRLRADLSARLSGYTIELPPLRKRREDLGLLIAALVRRLAPDPDGAKFHPDAVRLLLGHGWPQNVRELEKRLGAAFVLAGRGPVEVAHLGDLSVTRPPRTDPDAAQRALVERLLVEHGGNISAVARQLGKDRAQVRRWLRRHKIDPAIYRG